MYVSLNEIRRTGKRYNNRNKSNIRALQKLTRYCEKHESVKDKNVQPKQFYFCSCRSSLN